MKVVITLEDGNLPHVEVTDGLMERAYDTTPEAIVNLFASSNGDDDAPSPWLASPVLPPNTVLWATRNTEECLVLDIPAGNQPWVLNTGHDEATTHLIPLPRLLFLFVRQGKRIVEKALVAVADEGPSHQRQRCMRIRCLTCTTTRPAAGTYQISLMRWAIFPD